MFCLLFILSWWCISSEMPCGSSQRAHRYPHVKKFVAQSLRTITCTLQYPRTLYPWLPETKQHRGKTVSYHPTWLTSDPEKQHTREIKWHLTPTISQKTDLGKVGLKSFTSRKMVLPSDYHMTGPLLLRQTLFKAVKSLHGYFHGWPTGQDMLRIVKKLQVLVIPPKGQNRRHRVHLMHVPHILTH